MDHQTVIESEENLRQAMLTSDLDRLDALIADDLMFTTQTGAVVGKKADLDDHRSGVLRLTALDPSDRHILIAGESAVVSVQMSVAGTYGGDAFSGTFRYTRVWRQTGGGVHVVAGHMSAVT